MHRPTIFALAALLSAGVAAGAPDAVRTWTFEQDDVGAAPRGFVFATSADSPPGLWVVEQDGAGRVLAQLTLDEGERRSAMAVVDESSCQDLRLSVRGTMGESADQAFGLVWRWQGPNDYYLVRASVRSVRLFRVVNGNKITVTGAEDLDVQAGSWQALRVEQVGARIRVTFADRTLEAEDRSIGAAGKIGLWARLSAAARFDDLTVEPLERR